MNRTGLLIALAIALVAGLAFGVYPKLDLAISSLFYDPGPWGFWLRVDHRLNWVRDSSSWLIALIAAPAALALLLKLVVPRRPMIMPARAALFMLGTLALAPGLVTNVMLKEGWHRSRPIDIAQFAGDERFVPWWDPRGNCPRNCSFVAGEPSGAFWTLAPAALVPPPWRPLAYGAALVFGGMVGVIRLAAGGHFASDIVFAGVLTYLVIWLAYGFFYRWRATGMTDAMVEQAIDSVVLPVHDAVARLFGSKRSRDPAADPPG